MEVKSEKMKFRALLVPIDSEPFCFFSWREKLRRIIIDDHTAPRPAPASLPIPTPDLDHSDRLPHFCLRWCRCLKGS